MKALIIDDEPLARSIVLEYVQAFPEIEIMQECSDGFEGLKAIQQHKPDLIFLDVQMPKINGFEMLELVDDPPAVIFTTAFEEYAIKAFDAHAIDYLLKPFSQQRFNKAIQRWQEETNALKQNTKTLLEEAPVFPQQNNRIVVKDGNRIRIIPVSEIEFLEAADDYVKIHTKDGIFLKNKTMQFFEQSLAEQQFVRVHRSYLLNVQLISKLHQHEKENYMALLSNGKKVPVSKNGYSKLKTVLGL